MTADTPLIQQDHFRKVSLHNDEFAIDIIDRFLEQYEGFKAPLEAAIEAENFLEVKKLAQQLKSSAQVFGVSSLVNEIKKIERADKDQYGRYAETIAGIRQAFDRLFAEAEQLKASLS